MPAFAPAPFVFTSTLSRVINIDASTFPTCTVNDGGNSQTVSFDQLSDYIYQSDGDFILTDFSVNVDLVGYLSVRVIPYPYKYMPLSSLPSGYSYVNGVFTAPDTSSGGTSATVDLSSVYTAINGAVDMIVGVVSSKGDSVVTDLQNYIHSSNIPLFQLGDQILNHVPTLDVTPIQTNLELIKGYTDSLESGLSTIESRLSSSPVLSSSVVSLNGDYDSFKDGVYVLCFPKNREYKVVKSYLAFASGTTLTILYDLIDDNGKKHTAPHEALTLKV